MKRMHVPCHNALSYAASIDPNLGLTQLWAETSKTKNHISLLQCVGKHANIGAFWNHTLSSCAGHAIVLGTLWNDLGHLTLL